MFFQNTISAMGFFPQPEGAFPNCQSGPIVGSRHWHPGSLHLGSCRPYETGGRKSSMPRLAALLCALSVMFCAQRATAGEIKVTLLGTGTPTPRLAADLRFRARVFDPAVPDEKPDRFHHRAFHHASAFRPCGGPAGHVADG